MGTYLSGSFRTNWDSSPKRRGAIWFISNEVDCSQKISRRDIRGKAKKGGGERRILGLEDEQTTTREPRKSNARAVAVDSTTQTLAYGDVKLEERERESLVH